MDLAASSDGFELTNKERSTMLHIAALMLVAVVSAPPGSEEPIPYDAAYVQAQEQKKPLVVLVGADWCAACKSMKADTIHSMKNEGAFKEVVFTQVDKDAQPEIAQQVMQGNTLPQIVVFCESEQGWKRFSLTGMQSERRVKELLRKAAEVLPKRR
jgi:thioredoxin-like negative regulator of GroEL